MARPKILIADGDTMSQQIYEKVLVEPVFDVRIVSNGQDCMKTYEEFKPEIIFLSTKLAMVTTFSVVKDIRGKFNDKNVRIHIVGEKNSDPKDVKLFDPLGIQGFMLKPIDARNFILNLFEFIKTYDPARGLDVFNCYRLYLKGLTALNIIEVISKFTQLQEKNDEFIGTVPVNGFMETIVVNAHNQQFHFPKTGKYGNVFSFIQMVKNIPPHEALAYLAPSIEKQQ